MVDVSLYIVAFVVCLGLNAAICCGTYKMGKMEEIFSAAFKNFQYKYLAIYFLAVMGDWLQGFDNVCSFLHPMKEVIDFLAACRALRICAVRVLWV